MVDLKPYIVSFPLSEEEKAWLRAKRLEVAAAFAKWKEQKETRSLSRSITGRADKVTEGSAPHTGKK